MWYLFHGLLLLACALALTPSVVDSFCSLVPVTSLWFERVRSSSWGPTLVQHIVSTDTKPCTRPAVVFYFLRAVVFSALSRCCTRQLCVSCSCALLLYIGHPGCCSGAPSLGCHLAGLKRPSSAVLPGLVPPLARSVFCPGPHIPVRASCSWPRPGSAGPGVRSVRRSQCRRPGAGFGAALWRCEVHWRPRPNIRGSGA